MLDVSQLNWFMPLFAIASFLIVRSLVFITIPLIWTQTSNWAIKRRIIKHAPIGFKVYLKDMGHILLLHSFDAVVTFSLLKAGMLQVKKNESLLEFISVFLVAFFWIEIYFYYSHRILHHPKLFWIHRFHHLGAPLNALTSLSFSLIERIFTLVGFTIIPGFISLWVPISAEAFLAYFYMNFLLNVVGHMNVEIWPVAFVKSWAGRLFYTPTFHALHHIRSDGHFGLFTSCLDKLHGTYFRDYPLIHESISSQKNKAESLAV